MERKKTSFVGVMQEVRGFGFLIPDGNIPFDIFIPKSEVSQKVVGKKILVKINESSRNNFDRCCDADWSRCYSKHTRKTSTDMADISVGGRSP